MTFKSILVPLIVTDNLPKVIEAAVKAGAADGAIVEGLVLNPRFDDFVSVDAFAGPALAVMEDASRSTDTEARKIFLSAMQQLGIAEAQGDNGNGYRLVEKARSSESAMAADARVYDLSVIERPGQGTPPRLLAAVETLLFESGRPVLIVPPVVPETFARRIMIAWNCSSETAQATNLAMPLLTKAEKVTVVTVEGGTVAGPSGEALAERLKRHGIAAEHYYASAHGLSAGEATLNEATRCEADLIIKGAYTHSRFKQMIFGGVTSHLLSETTLPVFMAY